ncbi:MAG: lipoprotein signal peptidase [Chthoniobacteraceae bacterium]|nr:lipoprotein signal peptidase [Chthoniobacteraceae bacterium]
MKLLLSLALPLYTLDQATKWWVFKNLPFEGEPQIVIPDYFYLCHWGNTGAAFSSFHNSNTAFMVLSMVALIGLVTFYVRGAFVDQPSRIAVGLLLGGILGNLTDRIIHGHVIDFLLVDLHVRFAHPWPAFNVADACICTAAGLFILTSFRAEKKPVPA